MPAAFTDADAAELYDVLNPWDGTRWPADRFYSDLVMAATDVLDVGCGTGTMLHQARAAGHQGRLAGTDPDRAALDRARRRTDVEWIEGTAADLPWRNAFDLAVMASHAFQHLVDDADVRASLAAIHTALRRGGRFCFETRHPQARAWESWNPLNADQVTDPRGRVLHASHQVESVVDDVVTFTETTRDGDADGEVLRIDRCDLRFLDQVSLNEYLHGAGFEIEGQYGAWDRSPIDEDSLEIITIARRPA